MKAHREILKNGIRVVAYPTPTESISLIVGVKAGVVNENLKNNGISHFFEHMAFKGTSKRPTASEISREIDEIGAEVNAYTEKDYTEYFVKARPIHFEKIADLLADIIFQGFFSEEEIEKERNVIFEEEKIGIDDPIIFLEDLFLETLFKGTTYAYRTIGTRKSLSTIKRKDIFDYRKEYYIAENTIIAVAGKIPEDWKEILEENFSGVCRGKPKDIKKQERKTGKRLVVKKKEMKQANLALGFPTTGFLKQDYIEINLLSSILGGSFSSRLYTEIREKRGLAYSVRSFPFYFKETGYLQVYAGVAQEKVEETLRIILSELNKIKKDITEAELEKGKEQLRSSLVLGFEDTLRQAGLALRREIYDLSLFSLEEEIKKIDKVTLEQLFSKAEEIIDFNELNLTILGPFKDGEKFAKILNTI
ncbi:MAG: insulinase family protein [Patescibacteria group bacterium]|nr:insulinase family protein [Patescibacteria group bacterium]